VDTTGEDTIELGFVWDCGSGVLTVQSVFCLEMHQNEIFLFFKNYF
jgi:hypothetical protein